jgi:hypothetical protein
VFSPRQPGAEMPTGGVNFSQIPRYRGYDAINRLSPNRGACQTNTSCFKNFFSAADKYRKSHCNTLQTWITQHSAMRCAVQQRQKCPHCFVSPAARFIAGASKMEFVDEFTDVPMPGFYVDWKRTVFYRKRSLACLACLVGRYGAGA